jgi:hypothetical protein
MMPALPQALPKTHPSIFGGATGKAKGADTMASGFYLKITAVLLCKKRRKD